MKNGTLKVDAYSRDDQTKLASGTLLTIDNQIDQTTGTGKLKAVFNNEDNALWPNQFVNVHLLIETRKNTIVIPAAAIQRGQQGTYVFTVKPDKNVEVRPVTVSITQNNVAAISSGLQADEVVVTDGQDKLDAQEPSRAAHRRARRDNIISTRGRCPRAMSPSRLFILRPVATSLLMIGMLLVGIVAYRQLAGLRAAGSRLSHHSGDDVLSGRESGCDGLRRDRAHGAPVRAGSGPEPDDLHQFVWQLGHHAAIQSRPEHRRRRAGSAGCDQRRNHLLAARSAQSADLQQGQSGGFADPHAGARPPTRCRFRRSRIWPTPPWRRKFRSSPAWVWFPSAADKSRRCAFRPTRPRWPLMA